MKRRLMIVYTTLLCLAAFTSLRAEAQADNRMAFEIPFDFIVYGERFQAGRYTVERVNQSNPAVLVIKAVNGSTRQVFSTQRVESDGMTNQAALVFTRFGDNHFLFRIWWDGERNGRQLPGSDAERESRRGVRQRFIVLTKK